MSYLKQIQGEINEYNSKDVEIVPGLFHNQKKTIERIFHYRSASFETGDVDTEGDKKYFLSISRSPAKVTRKGIDFDTKHISVQTAAGGNSRTTWYFERDLQMWMKDKNFGSVLNRLFDELVDIGSCVIKVIDGVPFFVDLRNFVLEQNAETLDKSNYLIEKHYYTPMEYVKIAKEMAWENTDEVLEEFRRAGTQYIPVYERYGEVEQDGVFTYKRIFVADIGEDTIDTATKQTTPYQGFLLKETEVTEHPYHEFHLEKIAGRWLGVGVYELNFDAQQRWNELINQLAKSTYYASLHAFQSRDESINVNFNTEVVDGQVITAEDPITPIDTQNKNLAFFNQEFQRVLQNRDENTFSFDVVQGERLPSGTPLGSARLAASMVASHFDQLRENIALAIKEFLYKVIIPNFQKDSTKEHILRIAGDDLDILRGLLIAKKVEAKKFAYIAKYRRLPPVDFLEVVKNIITERVKQSKELLVKLPAGFYTNIKYKIDIIISGEQRGEQWSQTLFAALQAVTADRTILEDPTKRKLFSKWLEQGGLNIIDIEGESAPPVQNIKSAGGGISRPIPVPDFAASTSGGDRTL